MTVLPKSMIFVAAAVNSGFMKKIGPELAAIVREEATKAEAAAVKWGVADAQKARDTWAKNGGENIDMTGKDADEYLGQVTEVARSILSQTPKAFADYNKLLEASKKYK
jgi:TRAP-type C4-dicarboxylate transport system substrate-binding protein